MPKSSYSEVKRGTKKYKLLQQLLRKQGVVKEEFLLYMDHSAIRSCIRQLEDMAGYDIRIFIINGQKIYKCVGRCAWDGNYTDYTIS